MQNDFGLTDETRQGAIQSSFVVGFMVAAPIFAHLSHRIRPTILMAVGLAVWVASAVLAAVSWSFESLVAARILIGIGEASFAGLAPSEIDDIGN